MAVTFGLPTLLILQEGKGVVTNIDRLRGEGALRTRT
jgi:hypothetical protein